LAYSFPAYAQVGVPDNTIRFLWDDWNVEQAEEPIDEEFSKQLAAISYRANIAFTIATAEWILYRFSGLCDDPLPYQYVEAAWAYLVDVRYAKIDWETQIPAREWGGPVRGPVGVAMTRIADSVKQITVLASPLPSPAWITNLAQYVLPDPVPYRKWREQIMARLTTLYPLNESEPEGEVVPREALDPALEFRAEWTEQLVNRYLSSLEPKTNPFLRSAADLLLNGFKGTPYVFDIEKDRERRFLW